jgi:hypothetical protein
MITEQLNLGRAQAIKGWMTDQELAFLAKQAQKSKVIIEVGCFLGRSTRALADNTDGVIYAVDPWRGAVYNDDGTVAFMSNDDDFNQFYCNLYRYVESEKVIICRSLFEEWQGINHPSVFNCDFLFLDGDHRYDSVIRDIELALKFNPKVLAGHDYGCVYWPGVQKAVNEKFPSVGVEDTIWWTQLR